MQENSGTCPERSQWTNASHSDLNRLLSSTKDQGQWTSLTWLKRVHLGKAQKGDRLVGDTGNMPPAIEWTAAFKEQSTDLENLTGFSQLKATTEICGMHKSTVNFRSTLILIVSSAATWVALNSVMPQQVTLTGPRPKH